MSFLPLPCTGSLCSHPDLPHRSCWGPVSLNPALSFIHPCSFSFIHSDFLPLCSPLSPFAVFPQPLLP